MRTFDGATIYVPNKIILGDTVINYLVTPTRRLDLKINIDFDQADCRMAAKTPLKFTMQELVEMPAIGQPGKRVTQGEPIGLLFRQFTLRNVVMGDYKQVF